MCFGVVPPMFPCPMRHGKVKVRDLLGQEKEHMLLWRKFVSASDEGRCDKY